MSANGILILGGCGFTGKLLTEQLKLIDAEFYIICRNLASVSADVADRVYVSSLDNVSVLRELLPRCRFVFHLASDTTPGVSAFQPILEATANLLPTLRLLEILQEYKNVTLVYVSTGGAIYGNCGKRNASEGMSLTPVSYYGAGKAAIESFLIAYTKQTGGRAIILRPSNFYGPGQQYRVGFGIIPTIFHHVLLDKTIDVWGDGETIRDYLYIEDFVDCCIKILNQPEMTTEFAVYNIGSGTGTSLNDLFREVENVSGRIVKRNYKPIRKIDVEKIVLDCRKIAIDYSWVANTQLKDGLAKTWQWFQKMKV